MAIPKIPEIFAKRALARDGDSIGDTLYDRSKMTATLTDYAVHQLGYSHRYDAQKVAKQFLDQPIQEDFKSFHEYALEHKKDG